MENKKRQAMRNNKAVILIHFISVSALFLLNLLDALTRTHNYVFTVIIWVICYAPLLAEWLINKKHPGSDLVKHFMGIGFAAAYCTIVFTSTEQASYVFVIPVMLSTMLFQDKKMTVKVNVGIVVVNLILVIGGATTGLFGYENIDKAIIQMMAILMVAVFSQLVSDVMIKNNKESMDSVLEAKESADEALASISTLSDELKKGIDDINQGLRYLDEASEATRVAMQEVGTGSNDTAMAVQNQLYQTEEIQNRTDNVSDAASHIMSNMQKTMEALSAGSDNISSLAKNTEESVENGALVAEKLANLDEYMKQMNTIVSIIKGITSQTSLLALNASIEAARAGEAGRGFAVVATEISTMATQTQDATVQITDLITNVSGALEEVVQVIYEMIDGIKEGRQSTRNTVDSFDKIRESAEESNNNVNTLLATIEQLQKANSEIIDSIQTISSITEEVTAHAGETIEAEEKNKDALNAINRRMQELLEMIN